jgi:hypothetical protein
MGVKACLADDGTLMWACPGCERDHGVPVVGGRSWGWNNSLTKPTLTPSVNVRSQIHCHSFIELGKVRFLNDCTHAFAGKIIDLPDWGCDDST